VNLSLPLFGPSNDAPNDASNRRPPDPAGLVACGSAERAIERATQLTALHPGLWRASQIGGAPGRVTASGFDALDAELPGGGWPHAVLTELLLAQPGVGELRLLAPALAAVAPLGDPGRCVMLFDPPASLSAWALLQCGLDSRHWLVVQSRAGQGPAPSPVPLGRAAPASGLQHGAPRSANRLAPLLPSADLLWALEQSLKSGHVGAILAWLPLKLGADALRRLQIAAQAQDGPVFVFRDAQARSQPSPAPLRLLLQAAGVDGLSLRLLKRRGPSLAQPLRLALPSALTPRQQAQARDLSLQTAASPTATDPRRATTLAGSRQGPGGSDC
jgi:protein ImuA